MDIPRILLLAKANTAFITLYTREVRDAGPRVTHEAALAFSISAAARERCFVPG